MKIGKFLVLAALLCSFLPAHSVDISSCVYDAGKLKRAARDAEDAAENLESGGELSEVHDALAEVENRLRRAKSDCGYVSGEQKLCISYHRLLITQGKDRALSKCQADMSRMSGMGDFCTACLGTP